MKFKDVLNLILGNATKIDQIVLDFESAINSIDPKNPIEAFAKIKPVIIETLQELQVFTSDKTDAKIQEIINTLNSIPV